MIQAAKLIISGTVQKVGYRNWFAVQAVELELKGYVQNLPTAPVEAVVVGDERKIQEMIIRSQKGLIYADLADIQQLELNPAEYQFENFQIKYSYNRSLAKVNLRASNSPFQQLNSFLDQIVSVYFYSVLLISENV